MVGSSFPAPAASRPVRTAWALLIALSAGAGLAGGTAVGAQEEPGDAAVESGRRDTGRFAIVKDDTLGVRPAEGALYEAVLDETRAEDPAALAAEAKRFQQRRREALNLPEGRPFPVFPDLFKHPDAYRGRAVTLIGQARKIVEYPAGPTAADPDEPRVELWIYTDDAQTNPAVVVAAAAPGLPRGDDLREPVKVTGRFFKRYGYNARDDLTRTAPLILAATAEPVEIVEPPPATPFVLGLTAAVAVVGLSAGLWAWWLRPKRRRGALRTGGGEAPDLGGFTPAPDDDLDFPRAD